MSKYISDFRRGDTIAIDFTRTSTNSAGEPEPIPFIAGTSIKFSMKSDIDQVAPDLFIDHIAGSGALDDIENGKVVIILPSDKTKLLEPGRFYWDIQIIEQSIYGITTNTMLPPANEWKDRIFVVADVTLND